MIAIWILIQLAVSLIFICLAGCCCAERQTKPYEIICPKKREMFVRWHDHQIEQLGKASNTLFAVASAAFGYSLNLLNGNNQTLISNHAVCFNLFTSAFAVSLILGIISIFNRLYDFRWTAKRHIVRDKRDAETSNLEIKAEYALEAKALYKTTRRMGFWTWGLLYAQVFFFLLGGGAISIFWIDN